MFNPHAEPVGHVAPLRRIAINDPAPAGPQSPSTLPQWLDEYDRIWELVREASEGNG